MLRVKSEIELKVEEIKLRIKNDLDTYIKECISLQKNAINYDNMILENAIQQIECIKEDVDRLIWNYNGQSINKLNLIILKK